MRFFYPIIFIVFFVIIITIMTPFLPIRFVAYITPEESIPGSIYHKYSIMNSTRNYINGGVKGC